MYSIDCEVVNKGRRFSASKRRVCWKFGFPDEASVRQGLSGTDCRGAEHQVVLVWSLTSGKQRVLADGLEVHFARQSVKEKFECSWTMSGGHEIRVVAHSLTPLFKQKQGDRHQFELFVDGVSYHDMPAIYQLGGSVPGQASVHEYYAPSTPNMMNRTYSTLSLAGVASPAPSPRRAQSMTQLEQAVDLLDLNTPAMPTPLSPQQSPAVCNLLDMPPSAFTFQSPAAKTSWHIGTPDTVSIHSISSHSSMASPASEALHSLVDWTPQPLYVR